MVLAPEHPLVDALTTDEQRDAVRAYQDTARRESEIERLATDKEKTGVFIGAHAVNPVNGDHVPIWISDYVLMGYGTGAIMAVPAHDERDFEFATQVRAADRRGDRAARRPPGRRCPRPYTGDGFMTNSAQFNGMIAPDEAFAAIVEWLGEKGLARPQGQLQAARLADQPSAVLGRADPRGLLRFVRRRAGAGEPAAGPAARPRRLPSDRRRPVAAGAGRPEFVAARCPSCDGPARRETDTMDTFVCSSWYHLRYPSPHYDEAAFERAKVDHWLPVDLYVGGAEHAVMHLLYARFFCKVLYDAKHVGFAEPYTKLRNQGMIQAEDGQKMSKSKGNVVTPDSVIERYGADSLRLYELFIAPFEQAVAWNDRGVQGCSRFLSRYWTLACEVIATTGTGGAQATGGAGAADAADGTAGLGDAARDVLRTLHKTVRKVTADMEDFRFNTAVAALMEAQNEIGDVWHERRDTLSAAQWREVVATFTLLLAPMTPHVAEEVWQRLGNTGSVLDAAWPGWDDSLAADEVVTVVVQVNGKLRDRLEVAVGADKDDGTGGRQGHAQHGTLPRGQAGRQGDLRARQAGQLRRSLGARPPPPGSARGGVGRQRDPSRPATSTDRALPPQDPDDRCRYALMRGPARAAVDSALPEVGHGSLPSSARRLRRPRPVRHGDRRQVPARRRRAGRRRGARPQRAERRRDVAPGRSLTVAGRRGAARRLRLRRRAQPRRLHLRARRPGGRPHRPRRWRHRGGRARDHQPRRRADRRSAGRRAAAR